MEIIFIFLVVCSLDWFNLLWIVPTDEHVEMGVCGSIEKYKYPFLVSFGLELFVNVFILQDKK
jgi:hypothetical protein